MIFIDNYILIGNPIKHSISPFIHKTFFKDMKKYDSFYEAILLTDLNKQVVEKFFNKKIKGINITLPYKIDIIKYLHKIDNDALMIGAINTLKYSIDGYIGYNTDINGMEDTFIENKINIQNKNVLILGAGGSGYTASFMAIKNNAKSIIIANRTKENSKKLKKHILNYYENVNIYVTSLEDLNNIEDVDIVINTTTLGFGQNIDKSPLEDIFFKNNNLEFVFDIIYTPFKTKLLELANNNNVKNSNGFSMLIYQALKAQEIWQDIELDLKYKIKFKNRILEKYIVI